MSMDECGNGGKPPEVFLSPGVKFESMYCAGCEVVIKSGPHKPYCEKCWHIVKHARHDDYDMPIRFPQVKPVCDGDGRCSRCGLEWPDIRETEEKHICPPGFWSLKEQEAETKREKERRVKGMMCTKCYVFTEEVWPNCVMPTFLCRRCKIVYEYSNLQKSWTGTPIDEKEIMHMDLLLRALERGASERPDEDDDATA